MRIAWSDRARDDLYAILTYLAEKDPAAASRAQDRLEDALEHLTRYPGMGRPGRVDGTRELVVPGTSSIVPYRVRGEQIEVVAILHSTREWPQSFD